MPTICQTCGKTVGRHCYTPNEPIPEGGTCAQLVRNSIANHISTNWANQSYTCAAAASSIQGISQPDQESERIRNEIATWMTGHGPSMGFASNSAVASWVSNLVVDDGPTVS